MTGTIARLVKCFRKTRKYAILSLPTRVSDEEAVFPGFLIGGIIKAEIVEETTKALKVHYSRKWLPKRPFSNSSVFDYTDWMLKDDKRIVEVYES